MSSFSISRRKLVTGTAALLAAPAFIGRAKAATTLKISTSFPNDPKFSAARIWYDIFVVKVKAASDGQIATAFYPDSQLGQEADVVNQVKLGVVDAMLVGTPIWTNLVPEFGVFDLGYLFQNYDHVLRAAATPEAANLQKLLVQKAGVHFPTWGRTLGARNFMTKFAFTEPAGLSGRKIRCLPNPIVTETVRLMGAAATPLAFGEVYTGLQAGVIDGLEHDAPTVLSAKFYETAKFFTLTKHLHTPFGCFISDKTLQKLPPAQREALLKAVKEATLEQFARANQVEAEAIAELKAKGVTVSECNREAFKERVRPLWDKFAQQTPGVKDFLEAARRTEKA